jgi:hypothetical protein
MSKSDSIDFVYLPVVKSPSPIVDDSQDMARTMGSIPKYPDSTKAVILAYRGKRGLFV